MVLAVIVLAGVLAAGLGLIRNSQAPSGGTNGSTEDGRGGSAPATENPVPAEEVPTRVAEMRAQVAAIRGLDWKRDVPVRVLTRQELIDQVGELTSADLDENAEDLAQVEATLKVLGLLPESVSYRRELEKLFAGGVLGFYDDETKELFVSGDLSSPFTQATLAHELTHALTDQNFDFSGALDAFDEGDQSEETAGLLAVVEGDAELVSALWTQRHLDRRGRARLQAGNPDLDLSAYRDAPEYLLTSLLFPYNEGAAYVETLHREGGFAAVNDAYRRPPTSTAAVMAPEPTLVAAPRPADPPPPTAPAGCSPMDEGTLGQFDMTQVLAGELEPALAYRAAQGWNGDRYLTMRCGSQDAFQLIWNTTTPAEATELAQALDRWAPAWSSGGEVAPDGSFSGGTGAGQLSLADSQVRLVLADDAATARLVATAGAIPATAGESLANT
ncbi:MAG: hypothetical protein ACT4OS_03390 [Acidimicrobiales bacterium]